MEYICTDQGSNMKDERRKFTRYLFQDCKHQVFSHGQKIVGRLKDISKGGLAFQYTPIEDEKLDSKSINITAKSTHRFDLFDIACRITYDVFALEEARSFTGTERRQSGIKFVGLTENQQNKLELLLKNYTAKEQSLYSNMIQIVIMNSVADAGHISGLPKAPSLGQWRRPDRPPDSDGLMYTDQASPRPGR